LSVQSQFIIITFISVA